jgi:hypothetical protein
VPTAINPEQTNFGSNDAKGPAPPSGVDTPQVSYQASFGVAGPGLHNTWWPNSVEPSPVAVHYTSRPSSALTIFTFVGALGPAPPRVSATDG